MATATRKKKTKSATNKAIVRKVTFGGASIAHIRPAPTSDTPAALNLIISFEEALKLHLSLGQALARLNGYNRATKAGKQSALNMSLYPKKQRITINEGKLR